MHNAVMWFLLLIIGSLMAFSNSTSLQTVQSKQLADTLPQVPVISKRILKKKEWKQFKAQHYIQVVDSHIAKNKQFIHWYKMKSKPNTHGVIKESPFTKPVTHSWGIVEKVGKYWELTQWFVAPTQMRIQVGDTIDFNGDGQPEMVMFWYQNHYYNHEFGTGNNKKRGIYIWDPANSRNLLSVLLKAEGSGWNMCSGKSSQYSNHYYDIEVKAKRLHVKSFALTKQPKTQIYFFDRCRFRLLN